MRKNLRGDKAIMHQSSQIFRPVFEKYQCDHTCLYSYDLCICKVVYEIYVFLPFECVQWAWGRHHWASWTQLDLRPCLDDTWGHFSWMPSQSSSCQDPGNTTPSPPALSRTHWISFQIEFCPPEDWSKALSKLHVSAIKLRLRLLAPTVGDYWQFSGGEIEYLTLHYGKCSTFG